MAGRNEADVMLAGGSEAALTPLGFGGFCNMKALTTRNDEPERASRPFDRDRDGFLMGEGAAVLVLEELDHAKKRGARVMAEWFGECWHAADGGKFPIRAYINLHDSSRYFDLRSRGWVRESDVWP